MGQRAFYRWIERDFADWFPRLPERTRLFRRLKTHWQWAQLFLAQLSLLGIIDGYGVELVHPIRNGRNANAWAEAGVGLTHLQTPMTRGFICWLRHTRTLCYFR